MYKQGKKLSIHLNLRIFLGFMVLDSMSLCQNEVFNKTYNLLFLLLYLYL